ncbi:integral membrane protein [Podospora conica]|nr:integral membrane protein [Schizothecium conicum]
MAGESRASQLQTACILFFVLSPLFVSVRLVSRVKLRSWSGLGWDDATLLVSWILNVVVLALIMAASASGLGRPAADLSEDTKMMALQMSFAADVLYHVCINLIKVSIVLLYLRSFFKSWFRTSCLALLGFLIAFTIAVTVATVAQCSPVPYFWDSSISGTCVDQKALWYANAVISIITDVVLLALPLQPIHASNLSGGQKVALMMIFALGMFTTITTIVRMQAFNLSPTSDRTYDIDAPFWAIIETNLALICACLPGCKLPLTYLFPAQFSGSSAATNESKAQAVDEEAPEVTPFPRREAPRSRPGTANKKAGRSQLSISSTTNDNGKGLDDLPMPPRLNPDRTNRRSSMFRDAYVWLGGTMM